MTVLTITMKITDYTSILAETVPVFVCMCVALTFNRWHVDDWPLSDLLLNRTSTTHSSAHIHTHQHTDNWVVNLATAECSGDALAWLNDYLSAHTHSGLLVYWSSSDWVESKHMHDNINNYTTHRQTLMKNKYVPNCFIIITVYSFVFVLSFLSCECFMLLWFLTNSHVLICLSCYLKSCPQNTI